MMEVKVWTVVCVLLLANRGSAAHGDERATASNSSSSSVLKVTAGATSLAPDPTTAAALNQSDTSPTVLSGPSEDAGAGNSSVNDLTSVSPDQRPTPQLQASSTTLSPGGTSPANGALATTSATSVAHPDPVTHPNTSSSASVPQITTSAPKTSQFTTTPTPTPTTSTSTSTTPTTPTTTPTTPTTTPTTSTSTTSTGAPQGSASSVSTAITSPKHTKQTEGHPVTSSTTQRTTTATTTASSPSQLIVRGDTTVLHQAPALDPLLAGLVSAFIITAVIITLLLFLKLRRRNSRPEFRRLQDLPMDDMEDTPLSMYSY